MKIILTFIVFVFCLNTYGQNKSKELTQAEQFSSQAGTLIERVFIDIGKIKGIDVKVLKYKDLNSGVSKSALRFEYTYKSSYTSTTKVTSLDLDEIDGLIISIKNLQENVFTSSKESYTEVTYRSRTGFETGAYYSPDKKKWTGYIQVSEYDRDSLVFISVEDLTTFLTLLDHAKTKM